ncbi:MAG: beta-ketoacyl-ACP synthase III [Alphaproteobacteria bacterium]
MTVLRSQIIGAGHYLPERILTNSELSKTVDTSDEWIRERTGIKERHIAADNEKTSDLAFKAASKAIENAKITADDIDAIVLGTTTPDNTFPATAAKVQALLGMTRGFAFDVQAVCSGFIYALMAADNLIRLKQAKKVLVIGAETFSRILNWNDRNTCVLFGDGAGAIVLSACEGEGTSNDTGIIDINVYSDGREYEQLYLTGGPSSLERIGNIFMNGREVFKHAVTNLAVAAQTILDNNKIKVEEISWLLPHQANARIIDSTSKKLGIPNEKVIITVDKHANTSAASIPLALSESMMAGKIKKGDLVVMDAMGGGFTWGAALVRI